MHRSRFFWIFLTFMLCATAAFAQLPTTDATPPQLPEKYRKIIDSLHYQTGTVTLPGNEATLNLPADFHYLAPKDANQVIVDLWGNLPGEQTLGMILPTNSSPEQRDSWAVIITKDDSGYVKDDDAAKIDYRDLLKKMQESTVEGNAERTKQGYPPITLVGWAEPPHYDAQNKKLYWAKELAFGKSDEHSLNYDIRILGRRGVLSLNCVAAMTQLDEIKERAPEILRMVNFNAGHRYADFDASSDKVAKYGLAALVAGGVLAKAGLFKGLFVVLLAAKKFIIIGVAALFSFFKKLFKRKNTALIPHLPPPQD